MKTYVPRQDTFRAAFDLAGKAALFNQSAHRPMLGLYENPSPLAQVDAAAGRV